MMRTVRTSQPQQAAGIDWGNPITRGLVFACVDGVNLASAVRASTYTTSRKLTNRGVAFGFNSSTATRVEFTAPVSGVDMTLFALTRHTSNGNATLGVFGTGTGLARGHYLSIESGGNLCAISTTGDNWVTASGPVATFGRMYAHAGTFRHGGGRSVYVDGRLAATESTARAPTGNTRLLVGAYDQGNGGLLSPHSDAVILPLIFNRILTDAEIKSLSDNPWQIFQPTNRAIFVPIAAVISISRPSADVTTTGWTGNPDNTNKFNNIDEVTASDTDYITSPTITGGENITFTIAPSLAAGTWDVRYRAQFAGASAQVRIHLLDGSNVSQGVSSWQTVTSSFALYTASVTTTGTAVRVRIEVQ